MQGCGRGVRPAGILMVPLHTAHLESGRYPEVATKADCTHDPTTTGRLTVVGLLLLDIPTTYSKGMSLIQPIRHRQCEGGEHVR